MGRFSGGVTTPLLHSVKKTVVGYVILMCMKTVVRESESEVGETTLKQAA